MKIFCVNAFTSVSDYCGFGGSRVVSTSKAVEDYISYIKERIILILSKKPYLRNYPVYVSIDVKQPDNYGIFKTIHSSTVVLKINSDNSFHRSLKLPVGIFKGIR